MHSFFFSIEKSIGEKKRDSKLKYIFPYKLWYGVCLSDNSPTSQDHVKYKNNFSKSINQWTLQCYNLSHPSCVLRRHPVGGNNNTCFFSLLLALIVASHCAKPTTPQRAVAPHRRYRGKEWNKLHATQKKFADHQLR